MDRHIKEFYHQSSEDAPQGNFHQVISLNESPQISWHDISAKVPHLNRGWYELAHLQTKDRIEFTRDFWLSKLPYRAGLDEFLNRFFLSLDEIKILITQKKFDDPYEAQLIYSLKGDGGFFHGAIPILEQNIRLLQSQFPDCNLPKDYLAFLQIHDGFGKATDSTGVISSKGMSESYNSLQKLIQQFDPLLNSQGITIDPSKLIPFYESFGMPFYQCFCAEWYPEGEMGNVYYSGETNTISDVFEIGPGPESMAFPTFIDWLTFYLERIE